MKVTAVLTTTLFAVVLFACSPNGTESGATATPQTPNKTELTERILAAYERLRAQLASDKVASAADFENLAEAARTASAAFSGEAKGHLEQLASAAEPVDPGVAEGLDQVREAFGEVSQHLIALLSADPDLAKGRYVFECPMAKSYPKWVQQSESVSNPYLGPEMATCGVASAWQP
jgi:hypothetical protein